MQTRAWIIEESNGPFRETEIALPTPTADQVLVRIEASGVNPLDTKIRAGNAGHAQQPLPAVLGLDMAGTVVETGSAVTAFKPGDEVFGMVGGVGGHQGTLAEHILADAALLAHKPRSLSMREAAALPLVTITAWEGLVDRARVGSGQSVLIHAGAGGVGHVGVQIARAFGAKVFATVSANKKHVVESYGATPIDYRALTVEQYIAEHTAGDGFDIVYDTVGGSTLDASFLAVRRYTGHALSCLGWGTHALAPLSFRGATYSGVFTLMPLLTGFGRAHHGEILARCASMADAGRLHPLLNQQRFTTADIAAAHAAVEAGSLGKVVVEI
ncbi:zinc-dependent alcohol dehydrogenase family protein [Acidicapsa dinghuensis]|uniref:Zinc-dependent alcohol dehydrogenase family protein n=1 Tax=Acidicapsa dinghuensis TaxID=2218256 RepID=A0ABW1EJQ1_9BACT|nr:zinc-dependent alcohol dehydrogenase family protein [Acidicapsa dinghuensis]